MCPYENMNGNDRKLKRKENSYYAFPLGCKRKLNYRVMEDIIKEEQEKKNR